MQEYSYRFYPDVIENGSTFLGEVDLGFDIRVRKKIKLVNIKCHSINVQAGMLSKRYVEQLFKNCQEIVVRTFKDKFRKWSAILGIVYVRDQDGKLINLNDELVRREFTIKEDFQQQDISD